ncbi:MAG: CBS domain-containing protein [Candidatus Methylomirabilales bacterium]
MLVRDYMTSKVFTIRVDKKLFVAQDIMDWAHVRHVPVVDREQRVVGIVSHRDLLHAAISFVKTDVAEVERKQYLGTVPIEKVMQTTVRTIGPDATVQEAAKLMRTSKIGCLPVVDQGKLVGIISEYDLLRIVEQL